MAEIDLCQISGNLLFVKKQYAKKRPPWPRYKKANFPLKTSVDYFIYRCDELHLGSSVRRADLGARSARYVPKQVPFSVEHDENSVFEPIGHASVVDSIVNQIETLILSGVLRDGARLPSERLLAEQLGVSRPKVREALKQLEANDLIIVRHGEGTFIAPLIGSAMSPALISLYARHQEAFLSYLEFRAAQESFASELAASRATNADKEILSRIWDQLEDAHIQNDTKASQDADIRFHSAIIDASHNALLVHTMSSIYSLTKQNLFYNRSFLRSIDGTGDLLHAQHREIFDAICAGDPKRASNAARHHIDFVRRSYREEQSRSQRDQVSYRRLALM